ncbi:hypothetical protein ncot_17450 [Nocardioides sp. JQ2195]|uniref:hypothetical protein n=1 Tax=Nocardioides sp. JQ2195 TaxID=2592334 RepID=UPI00143ECD19|nr:hypothetical protein [Nocardioides sp. JQ2195]QIX28175.1 hypothetical protein ncot_17450 [Nocardioides sp. JQ2195]
MSSAARPRGPLPARVYWVRRAVVFGAAFLLIFGLARLLGSGSDGDPEGSRPTAEQAAGQQTDGATVPDTRSSSSAKAPRKKKTKAPLAQPSGPCAPADLTVAPEVDRVAANDTIEIPFEITGVEEACTFTVSSKSMVIRITSGSDLIWSSQQCSKLPEEDIVVRSAQAAKVILEWNGRRSEDDCGRTAAWAKIGWYHVEAAAFGGEPTSDKFELTGPEPEKVYKTVRPKPEKARKKSREQDEKTADQEKTDEEKADQPSASTTPSGSVEPNG